MRSYSHFDLSDRFTIFRMVNARQSDRAIAVALGHNHSAVNREIWRNGGRADYDPNRAQERYEKNRDRPIRPEKFHPEIREHILAKLKIGHAPDAIAGRLRRKKSRKWHISHQTIYNWIHAGHLGKSATTLLLFGKRGYRRRQNVTETPLNQAKTRVDQMPGWATNPKRFGNWQGDTVIGAKQKGAILTLVERKSKFMVADKLPEKTKDAWATVAKNNLAEFESDRLRSLILDNGSEMNEFQSLAESLNIRIFFAYPGCPWQKPLIENIHRMLRRFFPKGKPLDMVTTEQVQLVVETLNDIPRKSLNYRTPREVLYRLPVALGA